MIFCVLARQKQRCLGISISLAEQDMVLILVVGTSGIHVECAEVIHELDL